MCFFLSLLSLLRHRIGNVLEFVVDGYSFWGILASVASWLVHETQYGLAAELNPSHSQFLLIRGFFLFFLISLDRAAFWPCSRKCLQSAAPPLCLKLSWLLLSKMLDSNL